MTTPLATRAVLEAWAEGKLDGATDAVLERCLLAATVYFEQQTSRVFAKPGSAYSTVLNGNDADGKLGEILLLPRGHRPVIHSTPDFVTVTENGVSLTVAIGYSTTADVIVEHANEDKRARLIRRPTVRPMLAYDQFVEKLGYWAPGIQNITASYYAGYASGSIPEDVEQAVCEIALLLYRNPNLVGVASKGRAGHSAALTKELPPTVVAVIAARRAA